MCPHVSPGRVSDVFTGCFEILAFARSFFCRDCVYGFTKLTWFGNLIVLAPMPADSVPLISGVCPKSDNKPHNRTVGSSASFCIALRYQFYARGRSSRL
jgi:hypothetical protein